MTHDLKRLTAAVLQASARDDIELTDGEAEAVVRAVLMELREVSRETKRAGSYFDAVTAGREACGIHPEDAAGVFTAMINAILSDPAEA